MREIHVIDARAGTTAEKLRVAAYCRVSSDSDDQLNSFLAQVRHYTAYIGQNPEWELADVYADEGLTGTRMDKRDEFNRLMADCRKGQIDLILVKSTSRFARNTMEFLEALRELRQLGVTVWFENENMRTDKLANETMLALSGVRAQQESISISQNQRWSCQKRMQNGTFLPSSAPYGYRIIGGKFVIVEEEARIVRLIFDWYLSGMGKKAITDRLNATQAIKLNGFDKWYIHSVSYILCNDRYAGNALLQKKCGGYESGHSVAGSVRAGQTVVETTGKTGGTGTDLYVYQKDYLRPMRPVLSKTGYPREAILGLSGSQCQRHRMPVSFAAGK